MADAEGRMGHPGRGAEPAMTTGLTGDERQLIAKAREIGPVLRASAGDRDRLAGWLLAEVADLAERLGGGDGCERGRVSVDEAALEAFIAEADEKRAQSDSQFLCSMAEYEASDAKFRAYVEALDITPITAAGGGSGGDG
jgi:hypothetical protein